jgi:ATP synthase protein I
MSEQANPKQPKKQLNSYLKYSGMGFQLLAALILGAWLGNKADSYQQNQTPIWTLVLMFVFLAASMVLIIREISKEK